MTDLQIARFWAKVDKTETCWLWTGSLNSGGYGKLTLEQEPKYAHRVSYELFKGLIPDGLTIDHLCRIRRCVYPKHLEAVTQSINVLRGLGPETTRNRHKQITHCPQGHFYNEENTYLSSTGRRKCRECNRVRSLTYYHLRKSRETNPFSSSSTPLKD